MTRGNLGQREVTDELIITLRAPGSTATNLYRE
jgi:hypothetical protein